MLVLILINFGSIKHIMIDCVEKKDLKSLVLRVEQGNFSIFVNFMAIKYFDLTTVAMVVNCAPLLTVVLAAPILGERIFAI